MTACTCTPCTDVQFEVTGVAHCAGCCMGTRVEEYDLACPNDGHREMARRQFGSGGSSVSADNVPSWWAETPEHIRLRVAETARSMGCPHTTNEPDWWFPLVDHLMASRVLARPVDIEKERRSANALADHKVEQVQQEMAALREKVAGSFAADMERRVHRAAVLTRRGRKTVPVEDLREALGMDGAALSFTALTRLGVVES